MTGPSRSAGPTIVPHFGYRDAALRWLAEAFGFEKKQAYSAPYGTVMHAGMALGVSPSPTGHGIYVVVDDVDAHHERAKAAGVRIVYGPEDTDFGTRRYRALDPEGYEWSFGTCSPTS